MVALFAIEAGRIQRPTADIDILGDARQRPSGTEIVTSCLHELGASRRAIGGFEAERGFRFEVDGHAVDVLAPDVLSRPAMTDAQFPTTHIPGGSQALQRSEIVVIVVDGVRTRLRRPTLLGAILLKTRSLTVHSHPADQREDLVTLLGLLTDPRSAATTLKVSERGWLGDVREGLNLDDTELEVRFDAAHLRSARAAYSLLTA